MDQTVIRIETEPIDAVKVACTPAAEVKSWPMTSPADSVEFAPPALTNQWAMLSAGRDVLSYEGLAAPPVYSQGRQAEVYLGLDGGPLQKMTRTATPVTHVWKLDRVERHSDVDGIALESVLALSVRQHVVLARLSLRNQGQSRRRITLGVKLLPEIAATDSVFNFGKPVDDVYRCSVAFEGREWLFGSSKGDAWSVIELSHPPADYGAVGSPPGGAKNPADAIEGTLASQSLGRRVEAVATSAAVVYEIALDAGESWQLEWVQAIASSREQATAAARAHIRRMDAYLAYARDEWEKEWTAAFTPGTTRFSGHLPVLETDDPKLKLLYDMAIATVLYCKRTERMGEPGYVYATGLPSTPFTFAVTSAFLWDIKMIAGLLSMLDPAVLRQMMEMWMRSDIHQGYGVDFVTGQPLGFWYAINDYALIHMAWQYLRYTGDLEWLGSVVGEQSVLDHLRQSARYWRRIAGDDLLADYGGPENLLECVSTYTHKVPSFNAANVWNMRTVADLLELWADRGQGDEALIEELRQDAASLRAEALELAQAVQSLYCPGEGFWSCKQPDGSTIKVRHVLDFFTVMLCMGEDLRPEQKAEMVEFFRTHLQTPTWMHALSPQDPDAAFSSRTDHQDEGAYTTWPAYSVDALVAAGHAELAFEWLGIGHDGPGIADVAKQGPFGQAYYHGGEGSLLVCGAAAKAPLDPPHIEKPVLVSGGRYAQLVIESLAGIDPKLQGGVEISRRAGRAPVRFLLHHTPLQGKLYRVEVGS